MAEIIALVTSIDALAPYKASDDLMLDLSCRHTERSSVWGDVKFAQRGQVAAEVRVPVEAEQWLGLAASVVTLMAAICAIFAHVTD